MNQKIVSAVLTVTALVGLTGCPTNVPCDLTVVNATGFEMVEISVTERSGSDSSTFEILGTVPLPDGDDVMTPVLAGSTIDISAVDVEGDNYEILNAEACLNGEPLVTTITIDDLVEVKAQDCEWTITNDTGFEVFFVYARPEGTEEWGVDRLGAETLANGASFSFTVAPGVAYDVRVEDNENDTYTRLNDNTCVDGEPLATTFTLDDLDT